MIGMGAMGDTSFAYRCLYRNRQNVLSLQALPNQSSAHHLSLLVEIVEPTNPRLPAPSDLEGMRQSRDAMIRAAYQ